MFYMQRVHSQATQQKKSKKDEDATEDVLDEKTEGTLARVIKVMGKTGSRGGVTQVLGDYLFISF